MADNYTIGAMYSHTMTVLAFVLFAIMSILLVVRNTRSEEEDGILELIQAQPTGRVAHTASAILLLLVMNGLVLFISALLLIALGDSSMSAEGAFLTGTIYACAGLFFGAVTLVTAQLSSNARGAMMLAVWCFRALLCAPHHRGRRCTVSQLGISFRPFI
ncbi:MAG: hypothetical protein U5K84_12440 [Alkalibacterium sp.]|nr:hypothetical protein [Alkalibacterium sp.]